ncbi:MAG TPA: hypothetical protein VM900_00965, partial [Sphingomonas sp.]|nr:hypothetical protein [Sphingomonas sp.]
MTATRGDFEGTTPRRRSGARDAVACWAIVVAFVLLWQLVAYRGLIALAAEWQFDTFGRYYPALTYVLLVVVLGSPILWLMRLRDAPAAN